MAQYQLVWHQTLAQCALRAVQILREQAQQARALAEAGFKLRPFLLRQQQRHRIELPGAALAFRIFVNVVVNALLFKPAHCLQPQMRERLRIALLQKARELLPVRPQLARIIHHLVKRGGRRLITSAELLRQLDIQVFTHHAFRF